MPGVNCLSSMAGKNADFDRHQHQRDARSCRVREVKQEPDVHWISIDFMFSVFGCAWVSLWKKDIEGAEAVVFQGTIDWLDCLDANVLDCPDANVFELRDDTVILCAKEIVYAAIGGYDIEISNNEAVGARRRRAEANAVIGSRTQ